jgi:hypothetical protein
VLTAIVEFNVHPHTSYCQFLWCAPPANRICEGPATADFAEMPPPVKLDGRFVRIWICSWRC